MVSSLNILWITCFSNSFAVELLEECRRLCSVTTCGPGRALTALATAKPNAVVFDFKDPAAPDLQLLQSIKRLHPSVPILMFTEAHSEELAVWAFRARVWNYLVKPVPLRELKANLQQLARISQHQEPSPRKVERPATIMPPQRPQDGSGSEAAIMQRVIELIRRDHTSGLRIAQLARACGMSRFSFSRLFQRSFGCSCREYLVRLRIETACKMLREPNASVTRIAIAAGFTDASYFSRMFRRQMRVSPTEYARTGPDLRQARRKQRKSRSGRTSSRETPAALPDNLPVALTGHGQQQNARTL